MSINETKECKQEEFRSWRFIRNVFLKTVLLFILLNFLFAVFNIEAWCGKFSFYNHLIPGRERLPFGENARQSYNLSLYNLDAMLASHVVSSKADDDHEIRVFVYGDSSTWGTLLRPEETLTGQLNSMHLHDEAGLEYHFYNLGYPSLSLAKDTLILTETEKYQPDIILWLVTLEAFPKTAQLSSPIVSHNYEKIDGILKRNGLDYSVSEDVKIPSLWDKTIIGNRRAIADLFRLQFYGVLWAATGIDQYYPEQYEKAQRNLSTEVEYYGSTPENFHEDDLAFDLLQLQMDNMKDLPAVYIINEPILISSGANSDIRYNFYYPRWIYDQYRYLLGQMAQQNEWNYSDFWDIIPEDEFTNTAIHMTPKGVSILADRIANEYFFSKE